MEIDPEYISNLDRKFKKNEFFKLEKIIQKVKIGDILPKNSLVIMPSNDGIIRLKILDNDTPHKGFSTPLIINEKGINHRITSNYLSWFLSHDFVKDYLSKYASGSALIRIPKNILYDLKIPAPSNSKTRSNGKEVEIKIQDNPFRKLISSFYKDYKLNLKNSRYNTVVILAGAISEAILYQLLLDEGIDQKILENDRSLGLGKLITYIKILKLDDSLDFPITHFYDIQKKRNSAIHVGASIKKNIEYEESDLNSFNQIIKHFGI